MIPKNKAHLTGTLSLGSAKAEALRKSGAGTTELNKDGVQGEGDYVAAREFNEAERKFVASGKVAAAARAAAPRSEAEQQEMLAAKGNDDRHRLFRPFGLGKR